MCSENSLWCTPHFTVTWFNIDETVFSFNWKLIHLSQYIDIMNLANFDIKNIYFFVALIWIPSKQYVIVKYFLWSSCFRESLRSNDIISFVWNSSLDFLKQMSVQNVCSESLKSCRYISLISDFKQLYSRIIYELLTHCTRLIVYTYGCFG